MKFKLRRTVSDSVTIKKDLLFDPRVSLKAKGLYAYLSAVQISEELSLSEIAKGTSDGSQGIKTAIKELHQHKYLSFSVRDNEMVLFSLPNVKSYEPIESPQKKKEKAKKGLSAEEYLTKRRVEKEQFKILLLKEVETMKAPKPSSQQVADFFKYWGAIDDLDPKKPLPCKDTKKIGKSNFNIVLRLRTWMRNDDVNKTKDRL